MLDYWVRLYRIHRLPITQIVVLLTQPPKFTEIPTTFTVESTRHAYRIVKMWEEDPNIFLHDEALLPLAPLAKTDNPRQLLIQTAQQIDLIQSTQRRQEISTYTQILSGLRFERAEVYQLLREETMRDSVVYQDILQKGTREGIQQGIRQGIQQEARSLIQRQLTRKFGDIPEPMQSSIVQLTLTQLEALGEALLDFHAIADLETWLTELPSLPEEDISEDKN